MSVLPLLVRRFSGFDWDWYTRGNHKYEDGQGVDLNWLQHPTDPYQPSELILLVKNPATGKYLLKRPKTKALFMSGTYNSRHYEIARNRKTVDKNVPHTLATRALADEILNSYGFEYEKDLYDVDEANMGIYVIKGKLFFVVPVILGKLRGIHPDLVEVDWESDIIAKKDMILCRNMPRGHCTVLRYLLGLKK